MLSAVSYLMGWEWSLVTHNKNISKWKVKKVKTMERTINVEEVLNFVKEEIAECESESVNSLLEEIKFAINTVLSDKYDSYKISKKFTFADGRLSIDIDITEYTYSFDIEICINRRISDSSKYVRNKTFSYK